MIEISEVRKRIRLAAEQAKRAAAERRERTADAAKSYDTFLQETAIPVFRMFAMALKAEGQAFTLVTPQGRVRLEREPSGDFIELELDTSRDPAVVVGRTRYSVGRDVTSVERPVREAPVGELDDEDVVQFILTELRPFLAR
jgi:hypothetical protein